MEAQIGRPAVRNSEPCDPDEGVTCDHRSGGFADATNHQDFASPEWAVFSEKGQLRLKKVYKVEIVDLDEWKPKKKDILCHGASYRDKSQYHWKKR